jgi:hypothetical protein
MRILITLGIQPRLRKSSGVISCQKVDMNSPQGHIRNVGISPPPAEEKGKELIEGEVKAQKPKSSKSAPKRGQYKGKKRK